MARLFLLLLLPAMTGLHAQPFRLQTNSPLVNHLADSRSVALVDLDGDGWDDIFISNGPSSGAPNEWYRNQGEGLFEAVYDSPLVSDVARSDGATFGDVDNDGDLDGYVVAWYGDVNDFYRNEGQGRFTRDTTAGLLAPGTFAETAAWGDYNSDGYLDLFLTTSGGRDLSNLLFCNRRNGTFEVVSLPNGLHTTSHARGVTWADVDGDFDLDVFIANESNEPNQLFINTGDLKQLFVPRRKDQAVEAPVSSISGSWGDVDNDGDLDLFVANAGYFTEINNQLFLNDGTGRFEEVLQMDPVTDGGASYSSAFGDVDNDGDLDLLVTNGFVKSGLEDRLYENDGTGSFTRWEDAFDQMAARCSFGAAFSDLDQDGFLDLVVAHCNNSTDTEYPNSYYRNQGNRNHWLLLRLTGTESNRSAIGARIQVTARIDGDLVVQTRTIEAQSGYCGQGSLLVHFGLGNTRKVTEVRIFWPGGLITILEELAADQLIDLQEAVFPEETPKAHYLEFYPVTQGGQLLVRARGDQQKLKESPRVLLQDANGLQLFDDPLKSDDSGYWVYLLQQDLPAGRYLLRITCGDKTYLQRVFLRDR